MKLFLIRMLVAIVFVFTFIVSTFICTNVLMRCVDNMFDEKGIAFTYATNFSFILAMVFGGVCAFGIVKVLRDRADLTLVDGIDLVIISKLADRRNDSGSAATPSLLQATFCECRPKLVNADLTLGDTVALLAKQFDAGHSGDTGEN